MAGNIILQVAQRRVLRYADPAVDPLARPEAAIQCRNLEELLQRGIDALEWLRKAEEMLREADAQGLVPLSSETQNAVDGLYSAWLGACPKIMKYVEELATSGCAPRNLPEFKVACDEVEDRLERRAWQNEATADRLMNSSQEEW